MANEKKIGETDVKGETSTRQLSPREKELESKLFEAKEQNRQYEEYIRMSEMRYQTTIRVLASMIGG